MSQLIDFSSFCPTTISASTHQNDISSVEVSNTLQDIYKWNLNILVHHNPQKNLFTLREAAVKLQVGEEFVRRRIKSGLITPIHLGDKPMIPITELARILTVGVK